MARRKLKLHRFASVGVAWSLTVCGALIHNDRLDDDTAHSNVECARCHPTTKKEG